VANQVEERNVGRGFWSGAAFGMLAGIGSLLAYQYLAGILRRPSLISQAFNPGNQKFETYEALAVFIAAENLRSSIHTRILANGLSKRILHAGYRNFRESWARDFSFASYGLLALKHYETVRDNLEAFFWYQTPDGQLPVKLRSMSVVSRFLHSLTEREQPVEAPLTPKYLSGHGASSLDGQAMLVTAALAYSQEAEDLEFLRQYWKNMVLAVRWLGEFSRDEVGGMLEQGAYADWADSIARRGFVLYTNVVYWRALSQMAIAASRLDRASEAASYSRQAGRVARAIHTLLWSPERGYFDTSEALTQLSSDGNLLAIAWGLANSDQAASILKTMDDAGMGQPVPTRATYPPYPAGLISLENRMGGMGIYHTDASWLWLGAWHVIAQVRMGNFEAAWELIRRIAETIVRDRQVNEVHGPDGHPLYSRWYKSESPLTWNAGMVLYAFHLFENERVQPGPLSLITPNA
jgi:GH15 family glucan-1,4-alpha-glucosidase